MNIELKGRIDSNNAMQVEQEIQEQLQEGGSGCPVVLDAADLTYISSAGLRVILHIRTSGSSIPSRRSTKSWK